MRAEISSQTTLLPFLLTLFYLNFEGSETKVSFEFQLSYFPFHLVFAFHIPLLLLLFVYSLSTPFGVAFVGFYLLN